MKSILVVTGTTGFRLLETSVTKLASSNICFTVQSKNDIEESDFVVHKTYLDFDALDLSNFDAIIGHCGAGTSFWALSTGLPYLAVIDLTRDDDHQMDLGNWLKTQNYALVIESRSISEDDIGNLLNSSLEKYEKDEFDFQRLNNLLGISLDHSI